MKKVTLIAAVLTALIALAGCSKKPVNFKSKSYTSDAEITSINIDVRDREVEVSLSSDNNIHIDYFENDKEYYDISVSDDNTLTMKAVSDKEWNDFIGMNAPDDVRKISLKLPKELLNLSVSTTNEDISVNPITLSGDISLKANGGDIDFEQLSAQNISLDVKNGDIDGDIAGSYDDYAINCTVKKGESNLPKAKENGNKKLHVNANNGDVEIEIE